MTSSLIEHVGLLGAFAEGLISFFSPCVLPLLPIYFGYLSGALEDQKPSRKKTLLFTMMFIVGMFSALLLLNISITWISSFFKGASIWFMRIGGILIILLGLVQLGVIQLSFLERTFHISYDFSGKRMNMALAFVMGFTFSFSWTPCIGPALASVLILAGSTESLLASIGLIIAYALGFALPFLIISFFSKQAIRFFHTQETLMQVIVKVGAIILIVMGLLMTSGALGVMSGTPPQESDDTQEEDQAPSFVLMDQNDQEIRFTDFKGKIVYMNFWGTWCPICREELDHIQALYDQYQSREDVVILTFVFPNSGNETDSAGIKQFLQEHNYDFPVLFDEEGTLFYQYGISAYPTTVFIDQKQRVYGYVPGKIAFDKLDLLFEEMRAADSEN